LAGWSFGEAQLRNADCHAKNIALLDTSRVDVHLSPVYDFLTTKVYAGYQDNPPGIGFLGKKTWTPGKTLERFIAGTFGISAHEQLVILESISDSVSETTPLVLKAIGEHPEFKDIGKRMLLVWQEGVTGLRDHRIYAAGDWAAARMFEGISDPPRLGANKVGIGRSPLLGSRTKQPGEKI